MNPQDIGVILINFKSKELKLHNILSSLSRKQVFKSTPIIAVPHSHTNFAEISRCDFQKLKILQSGTSAPKLIKDLPTIMRELWSK